MLNSAKRSAQQMLDEFWSPFPQKGEEEGLARDSIKLFGASGTVVGAGDRGQGPGCGAACDKAPGQPDSGHGEMGLVEGSAETKREVEAVVVEAEDAMLSMWMIRGGGESGDKSVASWFLQGNLDAEGLCRVVRDRLGVADMDPACAGALLARIVGVGKETL